MPDQIALFGGSFDPPHVGHLLAAAWVLATQPVDELWFVPVHEHPFGKKLSGSFEHRVDLCRRAIASVGLARASVSAVEGELRGEGRTVDLLEHLHRTRPATSWVLVLGADLAAERPQWKRFDRIQELARLVTVGRGGYGGGEAVILPEVSSSAVRKLLKEGKDVSALVPRAVLEAIAAAGTYR